VTTLRYVLEEAAKKRRLCGCSDRPNPVGRPVEGLTLRPGAESFVGAGPMPMRHGLTMGELALWFVTKLAIGRRLPDCSHGRLGTCGGAWIGWPVGRRTWVNPIQCAEISPWPVVTRVGHVGGLHLSEGRGDPPAGSVRCSISTSGRWSRKCDRWRLPGCVGGRIRASYFEPTFHKHVGKLCGGLPGDVEDAAYYDHAAFKPWRLFCVGLQGAATFTPDYDIWRDFPTNTNGTACN